MIATGDRTPVLKKAQTQKSRLYGCLRQAERLARKNPIGTLGLLIVVAVVILALGADVLAPYSPTAQLGTRLTPPNTQYLLGTDEFGRDILSRLIYGARISLYVGIVSVGIAFVTGTTLGIVAGFYRSWVDTVIMRLVDIVFAFPSVILAIAISGILGPSLTNAMIAIGIVYAPTFARVARGPVLSVMQEEYIQAARTIGVPNRRIMIRHVLPNITAPLIVQTTLSFSTAILTEAALSFLGLGTQPPQPSWGTMLGTGQQYMVLAPWVAVYPGVAIMVAVLGFNLLGDGLRDILDPSLRGS